MKEEIEAQGKLKRARLDSAKNNSRLMETNIEELGNAEQRDSQVQTKVMLTPKSGGNVFLGGCLLFPVRRRINPIGCFHGVRVGCCAWVDGIACVRIEEHVFAQTRGGASDGVCGASRFMLVVYRVHIFVCTRWCGCSLL